MFDIAWSELFVILIVALVVVGPKDLPRMMRTVGQWAGRARAMADQFRRSFEDMARASELDDLRAEVTRLKTETMQPITDLDYKNLGIDLPDVPPLHASIEDVGAAPPAMVETPAAAGIAPVAPEETVAATPPPAATPTTQS